MILTNIPLVDWGMGTAIIVVFGVVCTVMILVVLNMVKSDKKK
ncbi:hypothetical protein [Altibacter sp.]|nr:hypothetical protein [Altibacter sp.]